MTRALVLGGGGPIGIAWELGVIAGLAEAGILLATADRIVGTSAGSVVGAQLASSRPAAELHAAYLTTIRGEDLTSRAPSVAPGDLAPLMQFMMRRPPEGPTPAPLLAEVGAFALRAETVSQELFLAGIGRLVGQGRAWPKGFVCTAVDAETGAFRVWDERQQVELTAGVASSCAVPGIYPPVTIDGRPYIDGGLRSPTNIDLADGYERVVVLAVTLQPFAAMMAAAAERELSTIAAPGRLTGLIVPDESALASFGANLMDPSQCLEAAAAGLDQGRTEAERVGAIWA